MGGVSNLIFRRRRSSNRNLLTAQARALACLTLFRHHRYGRVRCRSRSVTALFEDIKSFSTAVEVEKVLKVDLLVRSVEESLNMRD